MKNGEIFYFENICMKCGYSWKVSLDKVSLVCPNCNAIDWNVRGKLDFNFEIPFLERKKIFLEDKKSKNKKSMNKYKRVSVSTLRYGGGKSLGVGHVIEKLPDNLSRVISPFFGGGSIEIAIAKYLGIEVIGYDIFDILMYYWKYQLQKPQFLYNELLKKEPNKETFEIVRKKLYAYWKKGIIEYEPSELAVDFIYNYSLAYGASFMGWSSKIYLNWERYNRIINRIRDFNAGNLKVGCLSFEEVFKKYPNDFFYCDPPYYIGEDSKMFKGIYPCRNNPIHHKGFNHELLARLLKNHKGGWILSYNDCDIIREYYKDYDIFFPSWQYTLGQGETRIGKNRINKKMNHVKKSHEMLIINLGNNYK